MSRLLPDAVYIKSSEGSMVLAANKKGRLVLNRGLEGGGRGLWAKIARVPGSVIYSPEYRALGIEPCSAPCAMLCALHDAGLTTMYWCDNCDRLHYMDDKQANELKYHAISGAEGVMPEHKTAQ